MLCYRDLLMLLMETSINDQNWTLFEKFRQSARNAVLAQINIIDERSLAEAMI